MEEKTLWHASWELSPDLTSYITHSSFEDSSKKGGPFRKNQPVLFKRMERECCQLFMKSRTPSWINGIIYATDHVSNLPIEPIQEGCNYSASNICSSFSLGFWLEVLWISLTLLLGSWSLLSAWVDDAFLARAQILCFWVADWNVSRVWNVHSFPYKLTHTRKRKNSKFKIVES